MLTGLLFLQGSASVIDLSKNAVLHNQRGVVNLQDGYYFEAVQEFKIAIALKPDAAVTATFYSNLGLAYLKINKYKWAIDCFEKALAINPNFLEYYLNLVQAHKSNGSLDNLLNQYKKEIAANSDNSNAILMCGLIMKERGQYSQAKKYLDKYRMLESDVILSNAVKRVIDDMK